ncbi:MAG: T9SS type A sorting domain-containing protein [Bacteroidota bacterium]
MTNKFILTIVCLSSLVLSLTAQNLVPNPSFESIMCPSNYTGFSPQVETQVEHWYSANCASPDPMTNCSTNENTNVPDVWFGNQTARTGTNYMGFSFYDLQYEYLQVELTETLQSGQTYAVSFYLSCADEVQFASDAVGAYFSATDNRCDNPAVISGPTFEFIPQVQTNSFITEQTGWQLVSGTFTAVGGERYLTLGCYEPWEETSKFDLGSGDNRCYYYLDDVQVVATTNNALAVADIALTTQVIAPNTVQLAWKMELDNSQMPLTVERSTDGTNFAPIAHLNDPTQRSFRDTDLAGSVVYYYRLRATKSTGEKIYSEISSVTLSETTLVEIFPNPVQDMLRIKNSNPVAVSVTILSATGQTVLQTTQVAADATLNVDCRDYPAGIYFVNIADEKAELFIKH